MRAAPFGRVRPRGRSRPPLPPAPACDSLCVSLEAGPISWAGGSVPALRVTHSSVIVSRTHFFRLWAWVPRVILARPLPFSCLLGRAHLILADPRGPGRCRQRTWPYLGKFTLPFLLAYPWGSLGRPWHHPRLGSTWESPCRLPAGSSADTSTQSITLRSWRQGEGLGGIQISDCSDLCSLLGYHTCAPHTEKTITLIQSNKIICILFY